MIARGMALILAAAMLAGCQNERFRSQSLGAVSYEEAYEAGLAVFRGYYEVETANRNTGRIESIPKLVRPMNRRLSSSPTRELAVLRIRPDNGQMWADVRIEVQRQESAGFQGFGAVSVDREIPRQTPAQEDAPLTYEQREAWVTVGHNYQVERDILTDIFRALHPQADPTGPGVEVE